jgi:hypothetical protein
MDNPKTTAHKLDEYFVLVAEIHQRLDLLQPPLTFDQKQKIIDGSLKLTADEDGTFSIS